MRAGVVASEHLVADLRQRVHVALAACAQPLHETHQHDAVEALQVEARLLLAAGGLCLIDPEFMTDVVGVAVIVVVIVLQIVLRKHSKPAAA